MRLVTRDRRPAMVPCTFGPTSGRSTVPPCIVEWKPSPPGDSMGTAATLTTRSRSGKVPQLGIDDVRINWVAALGGMELINARFLSRRSSPHNHAELEIGVVSAGTRVVHCRGQVFQARTGSILAFAPGEVHSGMPDDAQGSEYRAFLIPRDRLAELVIPRSTPDETQAFESPVIADASLARQILRTHKALSKPGAESDRSEDGKLLAAIDALYRRHCHHVPDPARKVRTAVALVREHIDTHYADRIRLASLAHIAGLSVFHLIRIFRAATGLSPYAYLGQVRVHRAAFLLREGMAVSMVAAATGFADQSHLTRLFKRLVGVPPGEYQRASLVASGRHTAARRRAGS